MSLQKEIGPITNTQIAEADVKERIRMIDIEQIKAERNVNESFIVKSDDAVDNMFREIKSNQLTIGIDRLVNNR